MTDHGIAQWPEIGLGARDQLYRGEKKPCKFEKRCANTTGGFLYNPRARENSSRYIVRGRYHSPLVSTHGGFGDGCDESAAGVHGDVCCDAVSRETLRKEYLENEIYEMCTVTETSSAIFAERREASR